MQAAVCKKKRTAKKKGSRLRRAALIALALLLIFLWLEKNLEGVILTMAHARAEAMAAGYLNEAVRNIMGGEVTYEDMITVRTDSQGRVTMLQANAVRMNELATMTALEAQSRLEGAEAQSVSIPLGASCR